MCSGTRHIPTCADEWLARPDVPDSLRTCPVCKAVAISVNDDGQAGVNYGQVNEDNGLVMAPPAFAAASAAFAKVLLATAVIATSGILKRAA